MDELRETINLDKISKDLGLGIGQAVSDLHAAINEAISARYNIPISLYKVRFGKKLNIERLGKYVIRNDLEYLDIHPGLAEFPWTSEWGALNRGFGYVHSVEIVKGRWKVVAGRDHRGGFTDLSLGKDAKQMFERATRRRYPLRTLFGPSVAQMAIWSFDYDAKVRAAADKVDSTIASFLLTNA